MNSKHKLKRIKWGTLIIISCLIGAIFLNASAKSLSNSKAKKLANKTTACTVKSFDPEITMTTDKDEKNVKVTTKIKKNNNGNNFWLFISSGLDMDGEVIYELTGSFTKSKVSTIKINPPISEIYAIVVYKDGTANGCGITDEATAKEIAYDYVKNDGKFSDTMKNKISKNYYVAQGRRDVVENSDDEEIDTPDIDDDDISKLRTAAEEAEKKGETATSTEYYNMTPEERVNNLNAIDLYCSKNNVYKEGVTEEENYYTNQQTYYFEKTKNEDNCETTCKETVKVQYGPPVATKAGICFEYKVKVQSKVACKSTWKGGAKPQKQKLCNIYPVCNSSKTYYDQAGPDEEFDSCINKCDNGKYSQKCVNKCYKAVYENVNNKKISYNNIENNSSSKLLANKEDSLPGLNLTTESKFCSSKADNDPKANKTNYDNLIEAMRSYDNGCEYKYNNGKITWSCATGSDWSGSWKSLGRYYFYNDKKAVQTLQSIATKCGGEPRTNGNYHYYIDKEGFKRATFDNGKRHCEESCEWVASAKTGKPNVDCMVSKSERDKEYKEQLNAYIEAKNKCKAEARCSKNMATFTISAKDTNGDDHSFSTKINNSKTTVSVTVDSANRIPIIASGGRCYGEKEVDYDYMTEWGFPGSWISKKNGKVTFFTPQNEDAWYFKKGYYCTPFNSKGVNSDWFDWATNTKLKDKNSYESSKVTYEKNNISSYNISATTENFGYFGWKFNINCFYATPTLKNTNTPSTPDDPDNPKTPPTETPKFEYEARSIDTKDMFPDSSRGQGDDKTIGFNWTSKAKENEGTDYEIQPDELIANIQKQAKEGKTYSDDDNLEYDVTLDRKALNALKDMKVGAFDNGRFESTTVGIKGVKQYTVQFYRTNLLDTYGTLGNGRKRSGFCNNWDIGAGCRKSS